MLFGIWNLYFGENLPKDGTVNLTKFRSFSGRNRLEPGPRISNIAAIGVSEIAMKSLKLTIPPVPGGDYGRDVGGVVLTLALGRAPARQPHVPRTIRRDFIAFIRPHTEPEGNPRGKSEKARLPRVRSRNKHVVADALVSVVGPNSLGALEVMIGLRCDNGPNQQGTGGRASKRPAESILGSRVRTPDLPNPTEEKPRRGRNCYEIGRSDQEPRWPRMIDRSPNQKNKREHTNQILSNAHPCLPLSRGRIDNPSPPCPTLPQAG